MIGHRWWPISLFMRLIRQKERMMCHQLLTIMQWIIWCRKFWPIGLLIKGLHTNIQAKVHSASLHLSGRLTKCLCFSNQSRDNKCVSATLLVCHNTGPDNITVFYRCQETPFGPGQPNRTRNYGFFQMTHQSENGNSIKINSTKSVHIAYFTTSESSFTVTEWTLIEIIHI